MNPNELINLVKWYTEPLRGAIYVGYQDVGPKMFTYKLYLYHLNSDTCMPAFTAHVIIFIDVAYYQ